MLVINEMLSCVDVDRNRSVQLILVNVFLFHTGGHINQFIRTPAENPSCISGPIQRMNKRSTAVKILSMCIIENHFVLKYYYVSLNCHEYCVYNYKQTNHETQVCFQMYTFIFSGMYRTFIMRNEQKRSAHTVKSRVIIIIIILISVCDPSYKCPRW